mmetsp:Transcript_2942/g.10550  ORF Transcript_2942/g.10550 Transcript_2942/m.10550 type:complete len:532 (-) Transcript_2942:159-1754(-)
MMQRSRPAAWSSSRSATVRRRDSARSATPEASPHESPLRPRGTCCVVRPMRPSGCAALASGRQPVRALTSRPRGGAPGPMARSRSRSAASMARESLAGARFRMSFRENGYARSSVRRTESKSGVAVRPRTLQIEKTAACGHGTASAAAALNASGPVSLCASSSPRSAVQQSRTASTCLRPSNGLTARHALRVASTDGGPSLRAANLLRSGGSSAAASVLIATTRKFESTRARPPHSAPAATAAATRASKCCVSNVPSSRGISRCSSRLFSTLRTLGSADCTPSRTRTRPLLAARTAGPSTQRVFAPAASSRRCFRSLAAVSRDTETYSASRRCAAQKRATTPRASGPGAQSSSMSSPSAAFFAIQASVSAMEASSTTAWRSAATSGTRALGDAARPRKSDAPPSAASGFGASGRAPGAARAAEPPSAARSAPSVPPPAMTPGATAASATTAPAESGLRGSSRTLKWSSVTHFKVIHPLQGATIRTRARPPTRIMPPTTPRTSVPLRSVSQTSFDSSAAASRTAQPAFALTT